MTISLKHKFQSAKSDGNDATQVQPSNWNDEHTLSLAAGKLLGRDTSGAGVVQELPIAVDTSGNVGIGTSTLNGKLSIGGYSSTDQTKDISISRSSSGTAIQTGPNITFSDGTTNNTTALQVTQGRFGVWNYGSGSWQERVSVDSSGNVGIGTTSPATNSLDVALAFIYAGTKTASSGAGGNIRLRDDTGTFRWLAGILGQAGATSYSIYDATASAARMTIDTSGNVGIGTTAPAVKLNVGGNQINYGTNPYIALSGVYNNTPAYLQYNTSSYQLNILNSGSGSNGFITFAAGNGSEMMRIDSSGNVGIGTSSITTAGGKGLQIVGTSSASNVRVTYTGFIGTDVIQDSGGTGYLWNRDNAALLFGTNNAERMRIDSSGRVTKPYQPCFSVTGPYSGNVNQISSAAGGGYVILWQGIVSNNGSYYNTSTGRFTAPVTGYYLFSVSISSYTPASGPLCYIRKNGSGFAVAIAYTSGTAYCTASVTAVGYLTAGDYVDAYFAAFNVAAGIDMSYSNFSGCLIG